MSGVTYVDHIPLGTEVVGRFIADAPVLDFGGVRIALGGHPDQVGYLDAVLREAQALRDECAARQAVS